MQRHDNEILLCLESIKSDEIIYRTVRWGFLELCFRLAFENEMSSEHHKKTQYSAQRFIPYRNNVFQKLCPFIILFLSWIRFFRYPVSIWSVDYPPYLWSGRCCFSFKTMYNARDNLDLVRKWGFSSREQSNFIHYFKINCLHNSKPIVKILNQVKRNNITNKRT